MHKEYEEHFNMKPVKLTSIQFKIAKDLTNTTHREKPREALGNPV